MRYLILACFFLGGCSTTGTNKESLTKCMDDSKRNNHGQYQNQAEGYVELMGCLEDYIASIDAGDWY